jgi:hypothetical protein
LAELIERFEHFDGDWRKKILGMTSAFGAPDKSDDDRVTIRTAMRKYLHHHRNYDRRDPEVVKNELSDIDVLYCQLEPKDVVTRYKWLFADSWIELPENHGLDIQQRDRQIENARSHAIRSVMSAGDLRDVERLIDSAKAPYVVGYSLRDNFQDAKDVANWILSQPLPSIEINHPRAQAVFGLLAKLSKDIRIEAVRLVLERAAAIPWHVDELVTFLRLCPCDSATWAIIDNESADIRGGYWQSVSPYIPSNVPEELSEGARRFLKAKRAKSAFHAIHVFMSQVEPALIYQVIDEMRTAHEPEIRLPEPWYVGWAFDLIEKAGIIDERKLAELEFGYVGLLEHSERGLKSLERWLVSDPKLFAELIRGLYKPKHGQVTEVSEDAKLLADVAHRVLMKNKKVPGQSSEGTIDKDSFDRWVAEARRLCTESDHAAVGDVQIGQMLALAPTGSDGVWPCEGIRLLLDSDDADDIRRGFSTGILNSRRVFSRGYDEGGEQERALARKYRKDADALQVACPQLSSILRKIEKYYDDSATREDVAARLRLEGH